MDFGQQGQNFLATRGLIGGLFDDSGQQAIDQLKNNQGLYSGIALPNSKWQNVNPESINPESANYKTLSEDPVMKSKQLEALSKMSDLSNTGLSDVDAAGFNQARQMGDQMARSKTEAAIQDAQARGVAGGGLEFAMREQGNQDAAQRAQQSALQQAATSAQQRQAYLSSYANQLGQARDQNYRTDAGNTNIINDFNKSNTQTRNQANAANVQARNDAAKYNQEEQLGLAQNNFNNQMNRTKGEAGANSDVAKGYFAQNAANQSARNQDTQLFSQGMMGAF